MYNEALPSLMNLYNCKIVTLPVYKRCGLAAEDSTHVLFWCSKAKELQRDEMESWCMVAWGIRSCRNYFIHNKKVKPPLVLLNWVFDLLKEFQSSSNIASRNVSLGQFDAEVAWENLCLAKRFQLKVSWVERDAVNVVSGILSKKLLNNVVGPIIDNIKALLSEVGVVNYLAIPRARNLVAHTLAFVAFSSGEEVVWLGANPAYVASML
ncbi:hypothetical protein Q3G72_031739 [Acer saccharum]|nr:hypothetical protein Q3G72_031739 [Acer saccharum]